MLESFLLYLKPDNLNFQLFHAISRGYGTLVKKWTCQPTLKMVKLSKKDAWFLDWKPNGKIILAAKAENWLRKKKWKTASMENC